MLVDDPTDIEVILKQKSGKNKKRIMNKNNYNNDNHGLSTLRIMAGFILF